MFKRLFSFSQVEKTFKVCRIDSTHFSSSTGEIVNLAKKYFTPVLPQQNGQFNINININGNNNNHISININHPNKKSDKKEKKSCKRTEITDFIVQKMRSENETYRVKMLVVCHAIIRKLQDYPFMEIISDELDRYIFQGQSMIETAEKKEKVKEVKSQKSEKQFIQKHIISFTCQYLKKLILNFQTYKYAKQFQRITRNDLNIFDAISQGFSVLNLVNFILQSQSTFNKMGRYYKQYEEMFNLYVMFLQDLIIYNSFIKKLSKIITQDKDSLTEDEIRHYFLFITEAQNTSDQLYEYFHNRYYFKRVRKIIDFPEHLSFEVNQYKEISKMVKKHDHQLLLMIQNNKYNQGQKKRKPYKTVVEDRDDLQDENLNKTELWNANQNEYSFLDNYIKEKEGVKEGSMALEENFEQISYKIKNKKIEDQHQVSLH